MHRPRRYNPDAALVTPAEAAKQLRLAETTMAKMRSHGLGPPYSKFGRSVRYRQVDIDKWVAAHIHRPKRPINSGSYTPDPAQLEMFGDG